MRVNKRQPDYGAISRQSIQRDFQPRKDCSPEFKKPEIQQAPRINSDMRVIHINEICEYAKFARYIVGKLVRLVESRGAGTTTGWYVFVFDDDRKALNSAAGWSDSKTRYFLERPKFKN